MSKMKYMMECVGCGKLIDFNDEYYESNSGEVLCLECGEEVLYIHDFTQYDEYPLIDGEDGFDGGRYLGSQWRFRKEPLK